MHWIDPESLPETRGTVTRFLLNPHGEIDGIVLGARQALQVHFPPHLSPQIARQVAVGDEVRVRGVKPRGADMIAAVSLATKNGKVILDEGPHHDGEKQNVRLGDPDERRTDDRQAHRAAAGTHDPARVRTRRSSGADGSRYSQRSS